ncbi:hypothetical protein ACT7SV_003020 [Vibrio cholerae]
MKTFIKILSTSLLHLVSLGANAQDDTQTLDILLSGSHNYKLKMRYEFISANGSVFRSGDADCYSPSLCTIVEPPHTSLTEPGAYLVLSDDGVVKYVAPYGPEYDKKKKVFSDDFSLGKYIALELEKEGYQKSALLKKLGTDNMYTLYLTLAKMYTSSQHSLQETISYIESEDWDLIISNTPDFQEEETSELLSISSANDISHSVKDVMSYAVSIPNLKQYLGPLVPILVELQNFLDASFSEPTITPNQIYQKLDEIQERINVTSESLSKFYDIYDANNAKKIALDIHEKLLFTNEYTSNFINAIYPSSNILSNNIFASDDMSTYIDENGLDKDTRVDDAVEILNPMTMRYLNKRVFNSLLGDIENESLFQEYASSLLLRVSTAKNLGRIEDYTSAYETYNNLLLQQYFESVISISKSLYLELSALNLKVKHDAQIFLAADYGPMTTSNEYYDKVNYLTDSYKKKLDNLSQLLDNYLVEPDYKFQKAYSHNLYYDELDIKQAKYVDERAGQEFTNVVLANKYVTAYYTYSMHNNALNGVVYFIPSKQDGGIFEQHCLVVDGTVRTCNEKVNITNCYDLRYKVIPLGLEQRLENIILPFKPLPNEETKVFDGELDDNVFWVKNISQDCSQYDRLLTSSEIDSINERIELLTRAYP